jgi:hypothetical protein
MKLSDRNIWKFHFFVLSLYCETKYKLKQYGI